MATTHERFVAEITAKTSGAVGPLNAFDKQVQKSEKGFDKFAKSVGVSSQTLKAGLVGLGGAALGAGLVTGLQKMVVGYAEAAKAAGDLAAATGGSVQEVSGMQSALQDAGVSAEQSAAMLTKFTTAAGSQKGVDALKALNVELVKGPSGATDYAATMVKTVDSIEQIGDAATRNQKLVALFGKAGAKAFQDLQASGVSLSDAIAAIDTGRIFTPQDVRNAAAYDDAMDSLAASGQEFGNTLGRTIVPALNDVLRVVRPLVSGFSSLDSSTIVLGGSAAALALNQGRVVGALSASAGALRTLGNAVIKPLVVDYSGLTVAAGESAAAIDATTVAARRGGAAGIVSGLTKGVLGVAVAWEVVSRAIEGAQDNLAQFGDTSDTVTSQMVTDYSNSLSLFEKWGLDVKDFASNWTNFLPGKGLVHGVRTLWSEMFGGGDLDQRRVELERYREEQMEAAKAAGAYAEASLDARNTQDDYNTMLAEGGHSAADLAAALVDAGIAQQKKTRIDQAAKDALDAYAAASYGAVDATLAQIDADFALRDAKQSVADAVKRDGSNPDEVARAALRAASAQSELAKQTALLAGESFTAADAHDEMIRSLKASLKNPDLTKGERKSIQDLIDKLKEAQKTAKEGIVIGGIRFKTGTSKKEVEKVQRDADKLFRQGRPLEASALLGGLDKLKIPVEPTGLEAMKTELNAATKGSDGKDRTAKVNAVVVGDAAAKQTLDDLAKDRTATIRYSVVPPTTGYPFSQPSAAALSSRQAMPASLSVAGHGAGGAGVNYSPTIVNNYPKPERASDSVASSLRVARYLAGV